MKTLFWLFVLLEAISVGGFNVIIFKYPHGNKYAARSENGLVPLIWEIDGDSNHVVVSVDGNVERLLKSSQSSLELELEDGAIHVQSIFR